MKSMVMMCSMVLWVVGLLCLGKKRYSIALFDIVWGFVLVACRSDIEGMVDSNTLLILMLMICFFHVGYVVGKCHIHQFRRIAVHGRPVNCFNEQIVSILLVIALLILSFYSVRSFMNYGVNLSIVRAVNSSEEGGNFTTLIDTILFYGIAVPIIYLGAFTCTYNFSQKIGMSKKLIVLLVIDVVLSVLSAGGRTMIVRIVVFFFAALLWRVHSRNKISAAKKRYIILAGILVFIGLNLITQSRNTKDVSFVQQTLSYIQGSVVHMEYLLKNVNAAGTHYGYVTYGGFFYYPVKLIKAFLGLNLQTSNEIMEFMQQYKYLTVGGKSVYYNALAPNAYYYFFDSGYIGVMLFSLVLGITSRKSEDSYFEPSFMKFCIWAMCILGIAYSPFGGVLWNFSVPTALIYCFILRKYLYIWKPEQDVQ